MNGVIEKYAPRRRHPAVAQRRARPVGVGPAARCQRERHARAGRWRADRLGHARPGRLRRHRAVADRAHRDPARTGLEPVRRRCGRRRGPDHHPSRQRCATPDRRGRARRVSLEPSRCGAQRCERRARLCAVDRPRSQPRHLGGEARRHLRPVQSRSRRLSAHRPAGARRHHVGTRPSRRRHRRRQSVALAIRRCRIPAADVRSGPDRRSSQPLRHAGRDARLPRRVDEAVDDDRPTLHAVGQIGERRPRPEPLRNPSPPADVAGRMDAARRSAVHGRRRAPRGTSRGDGLRRFTAPAHERAGPRLHRFVRSAESAGRRSPRPQLGLRRRQHRQARPRGRSASWTDLARGRRHRVSGADLQRPVLPGLRRLDGRPRAGAQHRSGAAMARRSTHRPARRCTAIGCAT